MGAESDVRKPRICRVCGSYQGRVSSKELKSHAKTCARIKALGLHLPNEGEPRILVPEMQLRRP